MGVDIEQLKSGVTIASILNDFGIFHRRGRCACPVHGGDNPTAFTFTDQAFYCHTRGCKGDVVELVKVLARTDFRGACEYLAQRKGSALDWPQRNGQVASAAPHGKAAPLKSGRQYLLEAELAICEEKVAILTARYRKLRAELKTGVISRGRYDVRVWQLDEWLAPLDEEVARLRYELRG